MKLSHQKAITVLRVIVALLIFIHGVARAALGIVDDFGGFLGAVFLGGIGVGPGTALAWMITSIEICGSTLLALGRWVRPLALYFSLELTVGIILVHLPDGWFVVGAGRNGVEYSFLLISVLLAVALSAEAGRRPAKRSSDDTPTD